MAKNSWLAGGGPAFPAGPELHSTPGMTLRDWFAGQALSGMLAGPDEMSSIEASCAAYEYADAMLQARKEGGDASA